MNWLKICGILFMSVISLIAVAALPTGPSIIDNLGSSRYPVTSASNASAIAGNVTELNFESITITQTWQGYFGNITGAVVLGDSNNNTLYNWNLISPSGQIYATRTASVPAWASIRCANTTNINTEETALGVNPATDGDSVNRTFLNTTSFDPFFVGAVNINTSQNCYAVNLNNDTGSSSADFQEVLLHDDTNVVYTALLARDVLGFDDRTHDFEMIVGEDGHDGDNNPTPYYFYLELG